MFSTLIFASLFGCISLAAPPILPGVKLPSNNLPSLGGGVKASSQSASPHTVMTSAASNTASASPARFTHFDCDTSLAKADDALKDTLHALHEHAKAVDAAGGNGALATMPLKRSILLSRDAARGAELHARATTAIQVDLFAHVVESTIHRGQTTAAMIVQQVAAMNTAYNPYNIAFTLRNTSFTVNDAWAAGATDAIDLAMKTILRQGTYRSLNLYFQSDLAGGILGKCTLPTNVGTAPLPSVYAIDGCNIAAGSVPGGYITGYNLGKTAVHETGHWLGLLHTFEGLSCTGAGDYVTDTPQESVATDGCPLDPWKNSCQATRPGVDPVRNYLDYSTDACYIRFTPGQQTRMMTLWPQFRTGK